MELVGGRLGGSVLCRWSADSQLFGLAAHGKFLSWGVVGHNGSASTEVQTGERQQTVHSDSFGGQKQVI